MAKNKTNIKVTAVYDGELDATDVFVGLIAQRYAVKGHDDSGLLFTAGYRKTMTCRGRAPASPTSGICWKNTASGRDGRLWRSTRKCKPLN